MIRTTTGCALLVLALQSLWGGVPSQEPTIDPKALRAMYMGGTLQFDSSADILVTQIAADPISAQWVGVFLSRQLSLLADYALGATDRPPTEAQYFASEFRGYQIEMMAADAVTSGALSSGFGGRAHPAQRILRGGAHRPIL